ncbi:MAG: 3-isopropylmalate dehydratase [Chloroflexi bacterium]|nr:3-isopropylmalate dehydratase [Chloroflexota bacterium]
MEDIIRGKVVWQFGDNFNADLIVGSRYIEERDPEVLGKVCLADLDAGFSQRVKPGDMVIAGRNFGYGHPHYQGLISLQRAGVSVLIAESLYPVWYRMAVFYAFPALECPGISQKAKPNDQLEVAVSTGLVKNLTTGEVLQAEPMPQFLLDIVKEGGMVAHLKKKLAAAQTPK